MKLYSVYYTQQHGELSILRNIDLANRAAKATIPLEKIKELINQDKEKLIMMIMSREKTLFDKEEISDDVKGSLTNKKEIPHKPQYIRGHSDPQMSYSGF